MDSLSPVAETTASRSTAQAAPLDKGRATAGAAPPVSRGYVPELDGLRGIAILLILVHHFWPKRGPMADFGAVPAMGWVGVDLFFVISGFLITGILLDTREDAHYYRNFYARRALRILPLYYLFLIGIFVVYPHSFSHGFDIAEFRQQARSPFWYIFYIGNLPTAVTGEQPFWMLHPLWSLAIEEQFYIVFPLLVALLPPRHLALLLSALLVLAPAFRLASYAYAPANWYLPFEATPARVDVLGWGCLLAVALRRRPHWLTPLTARRALWAAMLLLLATAIVTGLPHQGYFAQVWGYSVVALAWATLVLWTVLHRGETSTAGLRGRPLRHLGKICYGLYLLHLPAEDGLLRLSARLGLPGDPNSVLMFLLKCASAVLLAQLSWAFFESRLLRLKTRFDSARHPASAEPAN
jgi:peptidoglycan/LPS O-acetylase OafA/YrhL